MILTLELPDEIEAVLTAQAEARGLTLQDWLRKIAVDRAQHLRTGWLQEELTPEEWVRQFNAWVQSHDRTSPLLSDEAVSRESIYPDRI